LVTTKGHFFTWGWFSLHQTGMDCLENGHDRPALQWRPSSRTALPPRLSLCGALMYHYCEAILRARNRKQVLKDVPLAVFT
jgi:hypothetical protein